MEEVTFDTFETQNQFQYSAVDMDELGASEYTLVNILVDVSSSVYEFKDGLEGCIKSIIESTQSHPKSENILVRVATFSSHGGIREIHGFTPLGMIDLDGYKLDPDGLTPLYDATVDTMETVKDYADKLAASDTVDCLNTIFFIITDGMENASKTAGQQTIADALSRLRKSKNLESSMSILIGVNDTECKDYLEEFVSRSGLNHFVSMGDATPKNLAGLANFVSGLVSSTSMVLGSGQSANVSLTI